MIEQAITDEAWLPVVGYDGKYEVSSHGRVRSLEQNGGAGVMKRSSPLILRQKVSKGGYLRVSLSKDSEPIHHLVHRLVLSAFSGPAPSGFESCHVDGIPSHNNIENLIWGSKETNYRHRDSHGRMPRGESSSVSKLSNDAVRVIRLEYRRDSYRRSNARDLAKKFGVTKGLIIQVVRGVIWSHVDG